MLKVLTFIGLGNYEKTTYVKHDDACKTSETDLFPEAVAELYEPDKIIAFVTPKVKDIKGEVIESLKKDLNNFSTNDIPDGNSSEELWRIFEVCAEAVEPRDEIILDITHAFRSIPLLVFIVAAYLRQVKAVELKHIIYGAFEARDTSKNKTPIFDLTPFVNLLNWMNAVNVFQRTGDARQIAALDIHDDIRDVLEKLSESLFTNRTIEVQEAASEFKGLPIHSLITAKAKGSQAPFQMLIEQLQENYGSMAFDDPRNSPEQSIKKQYEQIKWYMDNQHYFQAIILIREWLVSWQYLEWQSSAIGNSWLQRENRRPVEARFRGHSSRAPIPSADVKDLWDACANLRNDLAHCGMRPSPLLAEDAIKAIEKLFGNLEEFARAKGVIT